MVNAITAQQLGSWYTVSQRMTTSSQQASFSIQKVNDTTPSTTNNNVWEELSQTYNIRNATFNEIKEIASTLHKAGAISGRDVAILTFDYDRAANDIGRYAPISVSTNFSLYETDADELGRRDWIAEFGARAQKDLQFGNLVGYSAKTKILNILQQLEK
ncbi:hypothetical protein MHB42_08205 [Lysinibacillus sp. FSL K6-0232]|uniref:hypothetical protein n=1 Tax=unclassified Lysinibacillus TaxID=2636778 RepID=UPI0030F88755